MLHLLVPACFPLLFQKPVKNVSANFNINLKPSPTLCKFKISLHLKAFPKVNRVLSGSHPRPSPFSSGLFVNRFSMHARRLFKGQHKHTEKVINIDTMRW
uniref:(northern house mosquito) hypothetical protein n=1 Tax=Culex pipiens TaxID=7175 RepID=A0A8D8CRC3_CULPI